MGKILDWFVGNTEPFTPVEEVRESVGGSSPLDGVIPPSYQTHVETNAHHMLRLGSVYRSIQVLSTMVSQLDIDCYDGDFIVDNPPALVKRPDPNQPRKFFIQQTVSDMALHGEAFWRLIKNGKGVASVLEILDPQTIIVVKERGRVNYYQDSKRLENISHLKLFRMSGSLRGLGPLQLVKADLNLALMLEKYAMVQFDSDAIPRGQLHTTEAVPPDDMDELVQMVKKFIEENGGILALPSGFKYDSIVGDPNKTQFIEVQKMVDLKIARAFGVPPEALSMPSDGNSMTYQNVAQSNLRMLQQTLNRFLDEIEEQLGDLLPGRLRVKFREDDLMRLDIKGKWEVNKLQVDMGFTDGEELRKDEGKEPLPRADKQIEKKADDEN